MDVVHRHSGPVPLSRSGSLYVPISSEPDDSSTVVDYSRQGVKDDVEVAVTSKGERLALGIMNAKQAFPLPKLSRSRFPILITRQATGTFIDRES
ncbi:hypothetical protein FHT76_005752 [Rhizobium sp. BK176]|nr:hypothetical protein [Rhizobium sp. BK181]MCS4094052.1 hypothetical protein [Rhizobium sp. BK176]